MELFLRRELADGYKSGSQKSRVMTEGWVSENSFCPGCGSGPLKQFRNNSPVADFQCPVCGEEFELKSGSGITPKKVPAGEYFTMLRRIQTDNNPNFFFLSYDKSALSVKDFFIIPKHFFVPRLIEKRKPLSVGARRAGWTGCNIILEEIPAAGRIFIIKDSIPIARELVVKKWKEVEFLGCETLKSRGWLSDIMNCIEQIPKRTFTLEDVYFFENALRLKHPENNHIRDKIRQQLQFLRDKGMLKFVSKGFRVSKDIIAAVVPALCDKRIVLLEPMYVIKSNIIR